MVEKLAISGGTPVLKREDYQNWPVITEDDRRFIKEVLDSGVVAGATGPQVVALEKEWAAFVGAKYCLATSSGTAALHMALAAVGIAPGDEVLVPAFTFLASASCIMHQMAIPVFVDIEPKTYTIDPTKIEAAITERTRAILPVHIQGCPADLEPILQIAQKHHLHVIEDACQAHGAMYRGRMCGTLGVAGAFSLNNLKNLCGGEGGLFVTSDEDVLKKANLVRYFGDECDEATLRQKYNASILGYMYRSHELPAAFTRGQLRHLQEHNETRIRNAEFLEPRAEPDSRHHSSQLSAGVQARLLVLRDSLRPARRGPGCEPTAFPHRGGKSSLQGRRPGRPVAGHAGAGPGPFPEHDRHRQSLSVGHQ